MSDITIDQARLELEAQRTRYETAVENIAAAARAQFIEPFCDRNGLHFRVGNGTYILFPKGGESVYHDGHPSDWCTDEHWRKAKPDAPDGFQAVLDVCNLGTGEPDRYLFEYMEDYDGNV